MVDDAEKEFLAAPKNVERVRALIEAGRIDELARRSQLSAPTLRAFALGGRSKIMTVVRVQTLLEQLDEEPNNG